jgi:hypothetical protein
LTTYIAASVPRSEFRTRHGTYYIKQGYLAGNLYVVLKGWNWYMNLKLMITTEIKRQLAKDPALSGYLPFYDAAAVSQCAPR